MPRTAAKRNFGFMSPGLVRILTAADPDQVLTALEILGISPEKPETLEQALENVVVIAVAQVAGWVGPLLDLVDVVTQMDSLVATYSQEVHPSPAIEHLRSETNRIRAIAIASLDEFKELREDFIDRMLNARVQNPDVDWPPMPGIDPQL